MLYLETIQKCYQTENLFSRKLLNLKHVLLLQDLIEMTCKITDILITSQKSIPYMDESMLNKTFRQPFSSEVTYRYTAYER